MNKIFHVIRTDGCEDYDTYSDFVCIAENDLGAKNTNPRGYGQTFEEYSTWVSSPDHVRVDFLGHTQLPCGIICTSFHAG